MEDKPSLHKDIIAAFSLFVSLSTLLCCALPALLVAIGLGAVVAAAVSNIPGLIWLSRHKLFVFLIAGIFLFLASIMLNSARAKTCPIDPVKARACGRFKTLSAWLYWASVTVYFSSVTITFILPLFL